MSRNLKFKIILSTLLGTGSSIFFGFAVNHPNIRHWWGFGLLTIIVIIIINHSETKEERFFNQDIAIRESQKNIEQQITEGISQALNQRNQHLTQGDIKNAEKRDKYLSKIS